MAASRPGVFPFILGKRRCWAQAHPSAYPSVTLALHAGELPTSFDFCVALTPADARAVAVALEAAAAYAESTLASGLGESEGA